MIQKKLLLAGAALLLAAAAVTGLAAYEKSNVSDLLNANVEALAREESGRCTGPKS
ncbi:NVEALA domain-containing protein, partial [Alistipes communis]|uniref:NVEALA domain-containing protein n=1 Tax=Alistipes communis TaxID=2585118 RepID=UPI003A83AED4